MRPILIAIVLFAMAVNGYENCSGVANPFPAYTAPPKFMRQVTNGKLFQAGPVNDTFFVLHLYGTHYEMGVAYGQLMAPYFEPLWADFMTYAESKILQAEPSLPQWLVDILANYGLTAALDLVAGITRPFTPQRYLDEMKGIADGSGFSYDKIYQLNMFPELVKAACTIVGATKSATVNGRIAHLRGLDFSVHIPILNWPTIAVMHGNGTEPKVANFGWMGMVGSLTGISETPLGIGEKVWLGHKRGISSFNGEPWMFLLRDVLYESNIDAAINHLATANRTCAIHVGLGDGKKNEFRGIQMAHSAFEVFNWSSIEYPQHPIVKDVMYWDKHKQPTFGWCLSTLLKGYVGNITAENLALEISGYAETGDMHSVSFDYATLIAYFSNARRTNVTTGHVSAYGRQYTRVNVSSLFAEPLPKL